MNIKLSNKTLAWILGIGLILFIWHNPQQPLIQYAFLPWIGLLCILFVIGYVYKKGNKIELGKKSNWIPLAIIAGSIVMSSITNFKSINDTIAIVCFSVVLFGCYSVCLKLGKEVFTPFSIAVVIEAISIVMYSWAMDWQPTGGILSPTNYDIAAGLLILGVLVSKENKQWWLLIIASIGLFFTGAAEAIFIMSVLGISWFINRKYRLILACTLPTLILSLALSPIGITEKIWYDKTTARVEAATNAIQSNSPSEIKEELQVASSNRINGNWQIQPIKVFGYGYEPMKFTSETQHNIAMIIIEQVGILALLAWLFVAIKAGRIKGMSYIWIGFISMGIFDHYIWTQATPYFWCLIGVSYARE